jgi:RHS repeat-associated protein
VNGLTIGINETDYILGPGGQQVTEVAQMWDGSMDWLRTNVYAGGSLLATYNPTPASANQPLPSFRLTDWLGTMRASANEAGVLQSTCTGLPYGDGVSCTGDVTDQHIFTGKERDTESGNDYFGARYYAATMGRFLSPDPLWVKADRLLLPQRLNLYAYATNNPLRFTDPTGMDVNIGNCPGSMTISMCEAAIKNGVSKGDRDHIHFVEGDGKNGYKKGETGILVDKDYKGSAGNFTNLQTLANDHSGTARIDIYNPSESYSIKTPSGWSAKSGSAYKVQSSAMGQPSNGTGFDGYTFFPLGSNSRGPYSIGDFTDVIVNTMDGLSKNIYHELVHVKLGDFGRTGFLSEHGQPGVDQKTKEAEDEATKNQKDQ